jgi:hypothetical protein
MYDFAVLSRVSSHKIAGVQQRLLVSMFVHLTIWRLTIVWSVARVELDADSKSDAGVQQRPITVALVDLDASDEFIELVKSALLAALEALPPGSLFGLVTFSHKACKI